MNTFTDVFLRPKFRDRVSVAVSGSVATLEYGDQGCDLEVAGGTGQDLAALVEDLRVGGRSSDDLLERHPSLASELPGLMRELDALGLLTESAAAPQMPSISGGQFYADLQRLSDRVKAKKASGRYYQGLVDGTVSQRQLIGYALEYYHVVAAAPSVLAPALAWADTPTSKATLLSFFESELHHERFLINSLASVGIDLPALQASIPLPTTFALCSSLAAYSRQHLLSCKALLFLFEQPYDNFNEAFRARCQQVGLPSRFYEPIIKHAELNEGASHDSITRRLLDDVEAVAAEEQTVVKKHVAIVVETMVRQEEELMQYYADGDRPSPRTFV